MRRKLKNLLKENRISKKVANWVIEYMPDNYQEMVYVDPFCGSPMVLLYKEPSKEEIINDINPDITNSLRLLRDQADEVKTRLNKKLKETDEFYPLINCFSEIKKKKEKLVEVSDRLNKVYILNKNAMIVLKAFNNADSLVYINLPKQDSQFALSEDGHIDLANLLRNFKGKSILVTPHTNFYNRIYKDWRTAKNKEVENEILRYNY